MAALWRTACCTRVELSIIVQVRCLACCMICESWAPSSLAIVTEAACSGWVEYSRARYALVV